VEYGLNLIEGAAIKFYTTKCAKHVGRDTNQSLVSYPTPNYISSQKRRHN